MKFCFSVEFVNKLSSLNTETTSKKSLDKVTTLRKLSSETRRTRRCSIYEYYDE
jgi:hypothetical protein